jgi:hypothetical protein
MISLLPFFQWLQDTPVGQALRTSRVLYPLVESVHLLGLVLLVGAILVVDLGLLGIGMRRQPVSRIARGLAPLTWTGFGVMFVTGPVLLTQQAVKHHGNPAFWIKMAVLMLAVAFHFTVHRNATSDEIPVTPARARWVGCVSLALWISTGLAAKVIGFS